jgi:hypothetical protein
MWFEMATFGRQILLHILFNQPAMVLSKYSQKQVITDDLGHYTQFGIDAFTHFMNQYITITSGNMKVR